MYTKRYLHYMSYHPKQLKLAVAKTLLSKVNTHITDKTQKHSELQNICRTFQLIGFLTRTTFLTSKFTMLTFHCIQGTLEKVRKVLSKADVKIALKPFHTIDGSLLLSKKLLSLSSTLF